MVIGIDPGLNGGISILDNKTILSTFSMPKNKEGGIDIRLLILRMAEISPEDTILIEDVHSIFGASAKSNFNFGVNVGIIQAIVNYADAEILYVQPKVWQKKVILPEDVILKGKKKDTKATALKAAVRLFPNYDFRASDKHKIPHNGIIDAALIAYSHFC